MERSSQEYVEVLENIQRLQESQDWEAGTEETMTAMLLEETERLGEALSHELIVKISNRIYDSGMGGGFGNFIDDIAHQRWIAIFASAAMEEVLGKDKGVRYNREALVGQIQGLCSILKENLDVAEAHGNQPPSVDLNLQNDQHFLVEVRRLVKVLSDLRAILATSKAEPKAERSLAAEALRVFVLKLADGAAGTINRGGNLALIWLSIGILKDLGVPVPDLIKMALDLK